MRKLQLLLELSGSKQAERAAEISWEMAQANKLQVVAQHVVDTKGLRKLFACSEPGLIGSGPYAQAYEEARASLLAIGEKLCEKYQALANAKGELNAQFFVDEGDPVAEILKRGRNNTDVLIVGKPSPAASGNQGGCAEIRGSFVQELAEQCSVPLLLVSRDAEAFSTLKILLSAEQEDLSYVRECIKFAEQVGKTVELVLLSTPSSNPEVCLGIGRRLKDEIPQTNIKFKLRVLDDKVEPNVVSLWKHCHCNLNIDISSTSLMVVPTRLVNNMRMTVFGMSTAEFVSRTLTGSAMLWPEEFRMPVDTCLQASLLQKLKTVV
ncbi:MAG: universal stress protein [Candidatus Obscuribacterales bacterium]|nr:universal stress protein [Cyanobacteria bacterium SZAS LIN-5]